MLELPEAAALAGQLNKLLPGRRIERVVAAASPHKFAFFATEPQQYPAMLEGRVFQGAAAYAGFVQLDAGDVTLLFHDGVNLRYYPAGEKRPEKHQLLLELDDGSALLASVQMYGGLWAHPSAEGFDNPYYKGAVEKPSPLGEAFSPDYFKGLVAASKPTLSAKAFLATEQRIPGLGNGVLQDILLRAGVNPKTKLKDLGDEGLEALYKAVVFTLKKMTDEGGRDTEKGLYGNPGGYTTLLNSKSAGAPCPLCGKGTVVKQAYLGGSVYFCPQCQPLLPKEAI